MKTKILADFQICISVPLIDTRLVWRTSFEGVVMRRSTILSFSTKGNGNSRKVMLNEIDEFDNEKKWIAYIFGNTMVINLLSYILHIESYDILTCK